MYQPQALAEAAAGRPDGRGAAPLGTRRAASVDEFRLDGKVALVTGASRGIGRALALALARAGADVALASRDAGALESCADEARACGVRAAVVQTDVVDVGQVRHMVERTARELGRLDVLVNNAGVGSPKPSLELTEDDWDSVLNTNLRAVFFASQATGRLMLEQGVAESSTSARWPARSASPAWPTTGRASTASSGSPGRRPPSGAPAACGSMRSRRAPT